MKLWLIQSSIKSHGPALRRYPTGTDPSHLSHLEAMKCSNKSPKWPYIWHQRQRKLNCGDLDLPLGNGAQVNELLRSFLPATPPSGHS